MTNASCADCGRIVAFRTHDPSEIAECRNCGTWVKRSAEMPGVAVSVKKDGPVARKTAIPPRKDEIKDPQANPNINTTRSATKRTTVRATPGAGNGGSGNGNGNGRNDSMSAAAVYAAIRDLQKSVHSLRSGQERIQASQKDFLGSQKSLHEGQKALHSGQKQLFDQYEQLRQGQNELLERTLPVPDMPVPKNAESVTASATRVGPVNTFQEATPTEGGFFTTPFSSLKIPVIPISLADLDMEPQFTEEGTATTIPAEERSDRIELIEKPLPEPPPYVEPEPEPEVVEPTTTAEATQPEPTAATFEEATFDDTAFEQSSPAGGSTPEAVGESDVEQAAEKEADPFLTTAAHESPFTIEGPPTDPFTIATDGEEAEAPQESAPAAKEDSPFALTPQPFGAKEYTHEPCDIDDPFAEELSDITSSEDDSAGDSPFSETPTAAPFPDNEETPKKEKSLSQQIATAKEKQESQASPFDPSQKDLLAEPKKSKAGAIVGTLLALLLLLGAILFFFTDIFKKKETVSTTTTSLVEFPPYGIPLPEDDPRLAEAKEVAQLFLEAKTQAEVEPLILPVDNALLVDFWEPMTAPTIERIFQGRILEKDRVEVDFLVQDFGRDERLLPLIKVGEGPFQIDWKSFAECEEVTLLGLAQGTLILDSGEEIDQGKIRSWMQSGKELAGGLDLGNFQGFKLHNFTEEVVAFAVVRKDSPEFEILNNALATTELKHKGKPAIRAVLRVKRIEKEDPANRKPARLEILDVISTDWRTDAGTGDSIIKEELPAMPEAEGTSEGEGNSEPTEETGASKDAEEAGEAVAEEPHQLPPVPSEDAPLVKREGETPIIRVSID